MAWFHLLRPFTLLPPLLGMLSGAASAWGAGAVPAELSAGRMTFLIACGSVMAALLNAASNVLNQVSDVELDRVNKPERPLPRGEVSITGARWVAGLLYVASIGLAFLILPTKVPEVGLIVVLTAFLTWAYSAPTLRWRRSWWLAPLVIAVPRGGLLKVAGWGCLAPVAADPEPWVLGGLFFLFILGAASTKDFGDMEGDRRGGVVTLPLRFGPRRAAWMMAPFYVLPWLLLIVLARSDAGILTVDPTAATALGAALTLHGLVTASLLVRHAEHMVDDPRGRIAWTNLYLLMMEAQIGLAALYLLGSRA